jgi:hypothetical protein
VLMKRIKLGVRSVRVLGWIGSKESNSSRGFSARFARHKKRSKNYQEGQGPRCKPAGPHPLPLDRAHRSTDRLQSQEV